MNPAASPPPTTAAAPPGRVLRRLFLTLFLRGRSARGLQKEGAPKSVGQKLALTLVFYALFGLFALGFRHQPVLALSVYLHLMTFLFLGMFVAASAGEVLFNKEEGDILLHRPVTPRALLWAKIGVLVQVSLWLAGAFNLGGLWAGIGASDGGWWFPVAHAISTTLEALFCTGCVVLVYQLCLRWFGRERLDGLMTTAQVIVTVAVVAGSQLLSQVMTGQLGEVLKLSAHSWWIGLLPPAWFAGFDDAFAGSGTGSSWLLASLALVATAAVLWLAFGKLARNYATGLQTLSEALPARPRPAGRRWVDVLVKAPPLRWWLRDPVARAAFLLSVAYLVRDRDVKLRVYPGVAPMLVFPVMFLVMSRTGGHGSASSFQVAVASAYLGLIPLLGLNLLQYSQQWQAADLFRSAPIPGPAPLCHGARRAVLCVLTLPMLVLYGLLAWVLTNDRSQLVLVLPGIISLPVYAMIPSLGGRAVPLSMPTEEAKSAKRGLTMVGVLFIAMVLSGLASWAWAGGWFWWFIAAETVLVAAAYVALHVALATARWAPME